MNVCTFPLNHIPTLDRGYKIRWSTTGKDVDSQRMNKEGKKRNKYTNPMTTSQRKRFPVSSQS